MGMLINHSRRLTGLSRHNRFKQCYLQQLSLLKPTRRLPTTTSTSVHHCARSRESTCSQSAVHVHQALLSSRMLKTPPYLYDLLHRNHQQRSLATAKQKRQAAAKAKEVSANSEEDSSKSGKPSNILHYGTAKTGLILPSSNTSKKDSTTIDSPSHGSMDDIGKTSIDQQLDFISPLHEHEVGQGRSPLIQPPIQSYTSLLNYNMDQHHQNQFQSSMQPKDVLDMSTSYDPYLHLPNKPLFVEDRRKDISPNDETLNADIYETPTALGQDMMKFIGVSGEPLSVADFMKRCLRDEKHGYYTNPKQYRTPFSSSAKSTDEDDDWDTLGDEGIPGDGITPVSTSSEVKGRGQNVIGEKGDFTTAPEISQLFGECIAIWLLTQYEQLGKPSAIQLVEIGPGRGTLISDVLRSAQAIKGVGEDFITALRRGVEASSSPSLHLVEVSEYLRASQKEALQDLQEQYSDRASKGRQLQFNFRPWKSRKEREIEMEKLYEKVREQIGKKQNVEDEEVVEIMESIKKEQERSEAIDINNNPGEPDGIPVQWHDAFNSIPSCPAVEERVPIFVICQEIMDALPVHVFQKTSEGWRERMVDVVTKDDGVVVPEAGMKLPRFRYVLSPGATPALRSLLRVNDDGKHEAGENEVLDSAPLDSIIEVCPEAMMLMQDIAGRIEEMGGAALIIDYGNEGSGDTLRAFRKHKQVDVLHTPGEVDITADVDFEALRNAVNMTGNRLHYESEDDYDEKDGIDIKPMAFGPIGQGAWLASMGIVERSLALIDEESTSYEQAEEICNGLERLVSEDQMGMKYKVMAIARKKDGIFPPAGFV